MPAKKKTVKKLEETVEPTDPVEAPMKEPDVAETTDVAEATDVGKKQTPKPTIKKKPKVAPVKAKRTPSNFVLFSMEQRKKIVEENPTLGLGEVSKKCGEAWSALNEEDKKIWTTKAEGLRAESLAAHTKIVGDPKPKRRMSSYLCFSIEERKKILAGNPGLTLGEISKKCGESWKALSDADKEQWKVKANE